MTTNVRRYNLLAYFKYKVGLMRSIEQRDIEWLDEHTTGRYSVDYTIAPYNLSFENESDALLFKLAWGGTLACKPHKKF